MRHVCKLALMEEGFNECKKNDGAMSVSATEDVQRRVKKKENEVCYLRDEL